MEEQEISILRGAVHLFMRLGIRSVTMDDVSRELGISKKTLYKYVSNKAELVDKTVKFAFEDINKMIDQVRHKSNNAIDEIFDIDLAVQETVRQKHPAIEFQLAKYYPETKQWLDQRHHEAIFEQTNGNIQKGIAEGLYRTDFNVEFITQIYFGRFKGLQLDSVFAEKLCSNPEFIHQSLVYHIRGIASEKGLKYLENKLNKTN